MPKQGIFAISKIFLAKIISCCALGTAKISKIDLFLLKVGFFSKFPAPSATKSWSLINFGLPIQGDHILFQIDPWYLCVYVINQDLVFCWRKGLRIKGYYLKVLCEPSNIAESLAKLWQMAPFFILTAPELFRRFCFRKFQFLCIYVCNQPYKYRNMYLLISVFIRDRFEGWG